MKYLLMIYGNKASWGAMTPADHDAVMRAHTAVEEELTAAGEFIESNELSVTEARVLRAQDDVLSVTDGPYAESKEMLAGYYIVDCASLDRATEIAGRFAETKFAPIEVRQIGTD